MPSRPYGSLDSDHDRRGIFPEPPVHAAKGAQGHQPIPPEVRRSPGFFTGHPSPRFSSPGSLSSRNKGFRRSIRNSWRLPASVDSHRIIATSCVVALFSERNFAIGIGFKKTETVQTAILSLLILGESISAYGLFAILIGLVGVILMADAPSRTLDPCVGPCASTLFSIVRRAMAWQRVPCSASRQSDTAGRRSLSARETRCCAHR